MRVRVREFPGGPGASGIEGAAWRFESAGENYVKSQKTTSP